MKIAVIGAGIIGYQITHELATKAPSSKVALIGLNKSLNSPTYASGAMLNSICEVDSYTLISKYSKLLLQMCIDANHLWVDYSKNETHNFETNQGTYCINTANGDFLEDRNFNSITAACDTFGVEYNYVDPFTIPGLDPSNNCRTLRSIYIPNEGIVNIPTFMHSLVDKCDSLPNVSRYQSNVEKLSYYNNNICSIQTASGNKINPDLVIIAAGVNSRELLYENAELYNLIQPIFYGIGSTCELVVENLKQKKCIRTPNKGGACGLYTLPRNSNSDPHNYLIGASNYVTTNPDSLPRLGSITHLLQMAEKEINRFFYKAHISKINTGWRPIAKDGYPLLGQLPTTNIFMATGTKRLGVHLSPLISNLVSDCILHNKVNPYLNSFSPTRSCIYDVDIETNINQIVEQLMSEQYQHGYRESGPLMNERLMNSYKDYAQKHFERLGITGHGLPIDTYKLYFKGLTSV